MAPPLTAKEFAKHLNTNFLVSGGAETQTTLELVEVKGYTSAHKEQSGMERFSTYFAGPSKPFLTQQCYTLQHGQMGEFEIFLVPISQDERGLRYEAVFNYFKSNE